MLHELGKLMFGLVPDENAPAAVHRQWRKTVGVTVAGMLPLLMLLIIGMLSIFGMFPHYVDGFVRASELMTVSQQISAQVAQVEAHVTSDSAEMKQQYLTRLRESLLNVRAKECKAKTDEGRRLYTASITNMRDEYRRLTGQAYPMPDCVDL